MMLTKRANSLMRAYLVVLLPVLSAATYYVPCLQHGTAGCGGPEECCSGASCMIGPDGTATCIPNDDGTVSAVASSSCRAIGGSGVGCAAELTRRPGSLTVAVNSLWSLTAGNAYTIWFSSCRGTRTRTIDGDIRITYDCDTTNGGRQLYNLGGFHYVQNLSLPLAYNVPDFVSNNDTIPTGCPNNLTNGTCVLHGYPIRPCSIIFPLNCPRGSVCGDHDLDGRATGLRDAEIDQIRLWFKNHGPYNSSYGGIGEDQTGTFNGGCTSRTIYFPKDVCPADDVNGFNCTDVAWVSF